jgi:hypothetical protein
VQLVSKILGTTIATAATTTDAADSTTASNRSTVSFEERVMYPVGIAVMLMKLILYMRPYKPVQNTAWLLLHTVNSALQQAISAVLVQLYACSLLLLLLHAQPWLSSTPLHGYTELMYAIGKALTVAHSNSNNSTDLSAADTLKAALLRVVTVVLAAYCVVLVSINVITVCKAVISVVRGNTTAMADWRQYQLTMSLECKSHVLYLRSKDLDTVHHFLLQHPYIHVLRCADDSSSRSTRCTTNSSSATRVSRMELASIAASTGSTISTNVSRRTTATKNDKQQ